MATTSKWCSASHRQAAALPRRPAPLAETPQTGKIVQAVVIHNYRWRLGLAEGEPQYDAAGKRLAAGPVITVPTITLEGDANGAPHPDAAAYAKKFAGKYAHRLITGGIGHNLPQEAPQAFAAAVIDVDKILIRAEKNVMQQRRATGPDRWRSTLAAAVIASAAVLGALAVHRAHQALEFQQPVFRRGAQLLHARRGLLHHLGLDITGGSSSVRAISSTSQARSSM